MQNTRKLADAEAKIKAFGKGIGGGVEKKKTAKFLKFCCFFPYFLFKFLQIRIYPNLYRVL